MLVPLSWLKEYVDLNAPAADLAERLTLAGLELLSMEQVGDWWDPDTIVVGQVVAVLPHPDADRLVLVDVDTGAGAAERVVTGAPNLFQFRGQEHLPVLKVAFARAGALLVDAYSDQTPRPKKRLKPSKIRGVQSNGMVCSERELGLSEEHEGIMLLPADAPLGAPLRDYLGDQVLEFDLPPDMARCLCITGIAHELAALTGAPLHLPPDEWHPDGDDQAADYVGLRIEEPRLCNRYTGILIKDVQIGPSPRWMQDRLTRAGMRPINNIVDITNYVMLEWGQPLHAFDYDILARRAASAGDARPTIIVRRARPGEKFTTLDKVERELDDSMLMICDTAGSLAIAGVMGGLESEVSAATRNILLESATFEGINNRRTSMKLRLPSEASYRFARGIPATLNPIAARRAAELMRLYAGGRIVPGIVDAYPVPQQERYVYTTESDMRRILGMPLTLDQIATSLERLDFKVRPTDQPSPAAGLDGLFGLHRLPGEPLLECRAPWRRLDVSVPADLAEEVARIVGYEHVGTTLMDEPLPTQRRHDLLETEEQIRDILAGAGLQETIGYSLTTPENHAKLYAGAPPAPAVEYITLANPIAPERRVMRRSALVSALENVTYNIRYADRLAFFELGRIYLPEDGNGLLPYEGRRLTILLTGPRRDAGFHPDPGAGEPMDFFDLKGIVETLLQRLGCRADEVYFRARPDSAPFGPRCAELFVKERSLGLMGELHPQVRSAFGLPPVRISAAEFDIAPLVRPQWSLNPMRPISSYPPVVEDLAFAVPEEVTARQVQDAIHKAGDPLVVELELFDIYRGEQLQPGWKSLAYKLTYQSPDRLLSEKEVTALRQRIIRTVETATGGKLRQ